MIYHVLTCIRVRGIFETFIGMGEQNFELLYVFVGVLAMIAGDTREEWPGFRGRIGAKGAKDEKKPFFFCLCDRSCCL